MLVKAPFTYKATVLRPRKRITEEAVYRDHVDVAVREATEDDAPLVLERAEGSDIYVPPHRFHDDALWKPWGTSLRDDGDHGRWRGPTREAFLTGPGEDEVGNLLHRTDYQQRAQGAKTLDNDAHNVREVRESTRAAVMAEVVRDAANMLLIGDEVWVRTTEPVFQVRRSPNGDHVGIEAFSGERDQYRLDQGALIAQAETRPANVRGRRMDCYDPPEVSVLRPDLLRARTTAHATHAVVMGLVEGLSGKLREASPDDLLAYAAVRDGLRGMAHALVEGRDCDPDLLAARLAESVDLLGRLSGNDERHARDQARILTVRIQGDPTVSPSHELDAFTA